jgi:hypothetical protein
VTGATGATAEIDEDAKCNHEQHSSRYNERLQLTKLHDEETENHTSDDRCEAVKRCNSSGTKYRFIKADVKNGVEKISLEIPR